MQVKIQETKTTEIDLTHSDIQRAIILLLQKEKRIQVAADSITLSPDGDGGDCMATIIHSETKKPVKKKAQPTTALN